MLVERSQTASRACVVLKFWLTYAIAVCCVLMLGKLTFDLASTFYALCVEFGVVIDLPFLGNFR